MGENIAKLIDSHFSESIDMSEEQVLSLLHILSFFYPFMNEPIYKKNCYFCTWFNLQICAGWILRSNHKGVVNTSTWFRDTTWSRTGQHGSSSMGHPRRCRWPVWVCVSNRDQFYCLWTFDNDCTCVNFWVPIPEQEVVLYAFIFGRWRFEVIHQRA